MPTYTLNNVNYTYTVGTVAASVGSSGSASGNITLLSSFVVNGATYNVTSIAAMAFMSNAAITSVIIPDSVTIINTNAFASCNMLTSVTIPNSVTTIGLYAFNSTALTSVIIPDSVTTIGIYAFASCNMLTSVTIPNLVTTIGEGVFNGCTSLGSVTIPNSVTSIGSYAFNSSGLTSITIPASVTTVGSNAFGACPNLVNVVINSSDTTIVSNLTFNTGLSITFDYVGVIPASLCFNVTKLANITIGPNITSIGDNAFNGCTGLTAVTIPNTVTTIGAFAFYKCSLMSSATISNSVTILNANVFGLCSNLTSITIPNLVTSVGNGAFGNCTKLLAVTIPNSVTTIGPSAFYNCNTLTSVTMSTSVITIGTSAFQLCSKLTSITFPTTLTSIGASSFDSCSALTSIVIPNSLTTIGDGAFRYCSELTSITFPVSKVTTTGTVVFGSCPKLINVLITSVANADTGLLTNFKFNAGLSITFDYVGIIPASVCSAFSNLANVTMGSNITSIGLSAFLDCTSLLTVTIPSSVITIGSTSFKNCSKLTSVTIPNSVTSIGTFSFQNCSKLTSITISNAMTTIPEGAFQGCGATTVTIPNSVTSIGISAFNAAQMTTVVMSTSITSIGENAFFNCSKLTSITFPASLISTTSIGSSAFSGCTNLLNVVVKSPTIAGVFGGRISNNPGLSVTFDYVGSIPDSACYNLTKLTNVTIGPNITRIFGSAFKNCTLLISVAIPDSVTIIDPYAFENCSSMNTVTINNTSSLTTIGTYAFNNCYSLNSINIPASVTTIGTYAFYNCNRMITCTFSQNINLLTINDYVFMYSGLTSIVIPNSVRTIGALAFFACIKLTSATIPSSVTTMNGGAFAYTGLTNVTVPNITTLNDSFSGCINLTSITIPNTVTTIEAKAFLWCSGLTTITIPASVSTIQVDSFNGTESLTSIAVAATNSSYSSENGVLFNKAKTTLLLYPPKSLNTSYVIPSTVTSIQAFAFWKCANLTSITIPNSVTTIPNFAFYGLPSISSIVIDPSHPSFSSENGVLFNKAKTTLMVYPSASVNNSYDIPSTVTFINAAAFSGSTNLISVTIPNSVTRINDSTFSGCTNLTTATISTFITNLVLSAFNDCTSLTSIAIPASVTTISINNFSFGGFANVPNMVVDASNPNFSSLNGVLFNKNRSTLRIYPSLSPNNSYVIPSTVTKIDISAFWKCANLTTLTIPPVSLVNDLTFVKCQLLKTVIFSSSVVSINPNNFIDGGVTAVYPYNSTTNSNINFVSSRFTYLVPQNIPTLTFSIPAKTFIDAPFTITPPTSDISGVFTYTSANQAVATVSGDVITIVGVGSSSIGATLTCTRTYGDGGSLTTSSGTTTNFVVSKGLPTLSFSIPAKTVGNAAFTLVPPTSNSTGAFTYTSSNTAVASITNAGVITIAGAGVTDITATQATTTNYLANSIVTTFAVNATTATITPTITNFSVAPKVLGSAAFTLVPPTSDSSGAFTYRSSNTAVATVSGTTVTVVAIGSTTITAVQAGTATYKSGSITSVFVVSLTQPTILSNFSVPAKTFGNADFTLTPPTTNGNGIFSYTSSNTAVATIAGDVVTIVGGGTTTITATQSSTPAFTSATITAPLTVSKVTSTITDFSVVSKAVGDASFNITAPTSNSTGAFTYTSSDTSVATIDGNAIIIVGVGTSTITATQESTANYLSGSTTALFQVDQGILTLSNFSVPVKSVGNADFSITPPTTNSTGLITYTSSDTAVATIAGNVVTIVGVGSSIITASQESTVNYTSATITATFTVGLAATITGFSVPEKTFGDVSFSLVAPTTDSDGVITYTSSDTTVATIAGDVVTIVGSGTATITALQSFTAVYGPCSITASLVVNKAIAVLTDFSVVSKTFGDASFNLIAPTTNSPGLITYTSSDASVATVSGSTITVVGAGSSTITASQASTANYLAESIPATFTVNQATPTITNFVVPAKVTASEPFTLIAPTSNSSGLYTYTSSDTSVATIEGNVVTIVGKGTSTITATQESTANYLSGTITATLIVRFTPAITYFAVSEKTFGDVSFNVVPPTSDSDGTFTYTSSNVAVATIAGDVVTIVGAGSATITAVQALTDNYVAGTITAPFVVNKATTVLTDFSVPEKVFGNGPFGIVAPTTNSNGVFTYTSSDSNVATVAGSTITIVGAGSATITANQATTTNFLAGTVPTTFTVSQALPTYYYFNGSQKVVEDVSFAIAPPSSNSSGLYTYTSSDTSIATIEGNVVTILRKGTIIITATQESTANYLSGSVTATFVILLRTVMADFSVPGKTFGDAPFAIVAPTTNSNGAITYGSGNHAVATIVGNMITILRGGTTTITAYQASTSDYEGKEITYDFVVTRATTILSNFSVPAKVFGNAPFAITPPTTNSNGVLTYTSSNSTVATVSGSTITIVGVGSATITANQANSLHYLANSIDTTLTVGQATPTITNFSVPTKIIGNAAFNITAPTTNSPGAFTYTSSNPAVATIAGNTITIVGVGSATITADQATTTNYLAGTITANFQVNQITTVLTSFSVPAKQFANADFALVNPITNSIGEFTFTSSNAAVATIVGNMVTVVGVGTSTITVNQASTTNYTSGTATATLTVSKATTILSGFSVGTKTFGDASFNIIAPTTNGDGGAFTYTSSNTGVATIAGNVITIVGAGSSTITANQATTTNYLAATTTSTLTVAKAPAGLTNFVVPVKIIGNGPFSITPPTTNSIGAFTYTSSNTSVATVVGTTINILGIGTSTITATQATTSNFLAGTITAVFQVNNVTPVITNFVVPTKTFGDAEFSLATPTSNSAGTFSYTSSNLAVATIVGNVVTIVGGGTSTISAIQAATTSYVSGTATATLTVSPATTVLSNFSVSANTFGNAPFSIVPPTSNSNGGFTYTSSNTEVATIFGDVVTMVGAGSSTITATQTNTASYTSSTITASFQVGQAMPTISFLIPTKTIIDEAYTIAPPTSNSIGAFTYTSSNPAVATIVDGLVTIVALGTTTITAVQASTNNYLAATITATFQIIKATPTLTDFVMPVKTIGNPTFLITPPTTDSDGLFSYTSSDSLVATISGNRVTIKGAGTSTISAIQASTPTYRSGTVTDILQVNQITTVLTNFVLPAKTFGDNPYKIQVSSNSSGAITYSSSDTSVATIDGDMVTIVGAGTTTITVSQGSWLYYGSATISETLQVNQITTVLTRFNIPAKTVGNATFALVPPLSNRAGVFTYTSSDTSVATIDGNLVTIVGGGSSTITATQADNNNCTSATIDTTLTVNPAIPTQTSFAVPAKSFGDASFNITPPTSNSDGAFTYTSSNLLVATVAGDVVTIVGAGSCTISAVQASTTSYISATISAPFVISKAVTTMTNFSVSAKVFGNPVFAITPPETNSNGAITYTSSDTSVATISRNQITIVGIGSSTITAVQPITANYLSGTISTTFTVTKGTPVLTNFVVPTKIVGEAAFTLTPPTSNSDGLITYASSDLSVATIDGSTVTIVGRGTSTITANQASTTNFLSGTTAALFTVNRIPAVLTNFTVPAKTFGEASFTVAPPTTNSDGLITYTSSDPEVATIDGNTVTIVGGGNTTITAVQSSSSSYGSATIAALFRVNQIQTDLTNFDVPTKIIGEESFNLVAPTTNGDGLFTYTSSNSAVATIEGDVVTIVGLGNSTIRASQASTANYTSDIINSLFEVKLIRTVLSNFIVPAKSIGDASFSLVPPTTNSDGEFTYTSSNKLVATILGDVVTIVGTGNVTIIANQSSTPNSTPAQITASLIVNKSENAIEWFSVPEKAFGNAPFTLVPPTTTSNGAFTYTSSNTEVATISKNVVTIVGIGTSTITAVQANTVNYDSGTITATLTVGQGTPILTNFSVPAKTMGNASFSLVPPISNSDGLFTYTSSNTDVATVEGDVVTIVGVGTSTITANQASTTNYLSATTTASLTVNQITTVLTNFSVPAKTFGSATFTLVPPTSNSDGDLTYTSSDLTVATINDNIVTIVGAGNANITATQASTANYKSATMTALFQVNPITTVLTNFSVPAKIIGEAGFALVPPTSVSNNGFTYTSANTSVATIEGGTVTIVGLGNSIITAVQSSSTNYTSARITALFQVSLITTVLTNFVVPAKIVGNEPFSLVPPTSNTNGAFTYSSSNVLVATIAGDVVTIVGVGSCTITAVQASTANSTSATVSASFVVTKSSPTITNFVVPEKPFGNAPFNLVPPTTNGTGAFTYTSSDTDVATIVKNVVTIVGVGTSTITAVQASTTNFTSGTITTLFKVNPATAGLTNFSVPAKTFGNAPFVLTPPTTKNNTEITYTSSNEEVATIDENTVTIVGAGTSTITASQESSENYLAGTITATLTVNPATTVLTNFSIEAKAFGNEPFELDPPTTNSDGAITYISSNTAVATIDENTVTIVKSGISTISAVQASTDNYTSATITAVFRVNSLTTVLSNFNIPTKAFGNEPFAITPPTTNGDGAFTYRSSNTAVATIAGNTVTIVGAGSATISAVQSSSENYTSATITALFIVNKGTTVITNFSMPVKEAGMADFTITNPTSNSTGAFTYTSSNTKVATIFKNTVSIKGIGTSTITASQAMSANHIAGTVTTPFVVNQLSPTLSTSFVVPAAKTMGDAKFKLIAPKSNSTSGFTFTSSNTAVATIVKDMVTLVGAGTTTITATQPSAKNFGSKSVTGTLTVNPKIAFLTNFFIPKKIVGTAPFAIIPPTTNSNGAFTYTSLNTEVATIAGNMVTVVGVGTATITASQASTSNFTTGTISTSLVVNLPPPQVGALQITNKSMTNPAFTIVNPTKPNDNTGTWTYTSSKATIVGNVVTLLESGIVTITAVLTGDSAYSSRMLMTQFSVSEQNVSPSSFVFIRSAEVESAIPTTVLPLLNTVVPASVSTPANIAKFNPTVGTIAEKQANHSMVVNALCNMFPSAITISVPTPLFYVPLTFNKTKLKTIKILRPNGTTSETPLIPVTVASDSAVGLLCSFVNSGNSIQLDGTGTFTGSFIKIVKRVDNKYTVTKSLKGVPTTTIASMGDVISFIGMTAMISYL